MPVVVFIGGVPNAGKSTIAAGLACSYLNTAFVDGDFVLLDTEEQALSKEPLKHLWSKKLEKIISIVQKKLSENMNVIVAWPLRRKSYDLIQAALPKDTKFYYVFLNPCLDSLEDNRTTRVLNDWEKQRGLEMQRENYADQHFCDFRIDNSAQTPFKTV